MSFQSFDKTSKLSDTECKYCLKDFHSAQACKTHQEHCSSEELKWKCEECGKGYKTKNGLNWHKSQHQQLQITYACRQSECSRTYNSLSELRKHCYLVDHAFPQVEGPVLENEERCEICYKVYQKYSIIFHMEKHQKKSRRTYQDLYKCEDCDFKTKRKNNFTRHMETKHNTWNINFDVIQEHFDQLNKNYECPRCQKICKSYEEAANHLKVRNCKDENICKICNISFTMNQNLKAHRKRKHPDSDK